MAICALSYQSPNSIIMHWPFMQYTRALLFYLYMIIKTNLIDHTVLSILTVLANCTLGWQIYKFLVTMAWTEYECVSNNFKADLNYTEGWIYLI